MARASRLSSWCRLLAVGVTQAAQPRWVRTSWIDVGKVRLLIPPSASRGARGRVVLRRPRAARPRGTGRSEARGQGPGSLSPGHMIAGSPRLPVPVFAVVSLYYASDLTRPAHRAARATSRKLSFVRGTLTDVLDPPIASLKARRTARAGTVGLDKRHAPTPPRRPRVRRRRKCR